MPSRLPKTVVSIEPTPKNGSLSSRQQTGSRINNTKNKKKNNSESDEDGEEEGEEFVVEAATGPRRSARSNMYRGTFERDEALDNGSDEDDDFESDDSDEEDSSSATETEDEPCESEEDEEDEIPKTRARR